MENRQIKPGADRRFIKRSRQQISFEYLLAVKFLFDDCWLSLITAYDGSRPARLVHSTCMRHNSLRASHIFARSGSAAIFPGAARHAGHFIRHCALGHSAVVQNHREAGIGQEEKHQKMAT